MVQAYWHVGRLIVEAQGGEERAAYGDGLIRELAKRLTADFGKGFTTTNLKNMRTFYLTVQTSPKSSSSTTPRPGNLLQFRFYWSRLR